MNLYCPNCRKAIVSPCDLAEGQHVLCPYCEVKFSFTYSNPRLVKKLGFLDCYLEAFRKYGDFSGRATRFEWWCFTLIQFVIIAAIKFVEKRILHMEILSAIYCLATGLPYIALTVRRLHDCHRSGWWYGLFWVVMIAVSFLIVAFVKNGLLLWSCLLIYLLNWVAFIYYMCKSGDKGSNVYDGKYL